MTVTNQQLAECFRQAKAMLHDGHRDIGGYSFICNAIEDSYCAVDVRIAAKEVIKASLEGRPTLSSWLLLIKGVDTDVPDFLERIQATRHAWLDHLIKEYSKC